MGNFKLCLVLLLFNQYKVTCGQRSTNESIYEDTSFSNSQDVSEENLETITGHDDTTPSNNTTIIDAIVNTPIHVQTEDTNGVNHENRGPPPNGKLPNETYTKPGLISDEISERVSRILTFSTIPIQTATIVANMFTIMVYRRPPMKNPVSIYIIANSIVDVVANVVVAVRSVLVEYEVTQYALRILHIAASTCHHYTNSIMFLIAMERTMCLLFPLQKRRILSRFPKTILCILLVVILAVNSLEVVVIIKGRSDFSDMLINVSAVKKILLVHVLLVLIVVFNMVTLVCLKRRTKARLKLGISCTKMERQKRQTTTILLVVTFVYVALALPSTSVSVLKDMRPDFRNRGRYRNLANILYLIGCITDSLMNASDFVIFSFLSGKFRSAVKEVFTTYTTERSDWLKS